jgi:3'-phosphoadenosine 5'-phosphosulfate (PAPS) 3'-phosphatase
VTDRAKVRSLQTFKKELEIGAQVVTKACQGSGISAYEAIVTGIAHAFPGDFILSTQTQDHLERLERDRIWLVNITSNGSSTNTPGSAMLALLEAHALELGIVYYPLPDTLYFAMRGSGAYKSTEGPAERLACAPSRNGVRIISPNQNGIFDQLRRQRIFDVRPAESRDPGLLSVLEGGADLFIETQPVAEWETAAADLLISEAGGSVTDCWGRALRYNKPVANQVDGVMAAHPGVAFRALPAIIRILKESKQDAAL